jgi:hypothetical protein
MLAGELASELKMNRSSLNLGDLPQLAVGFFKWFLSVENPVTLGKRRAGFCVLWPQERRVEEILGSKRE